MQRAAYAHRPTRAYAYAVPRAIIPGLDRRALDKRNARARRNRRSYACARLRRVADMDALANLDTHPHPYA